MADKHKESAQSVHAFIFAEIRINIVFLYNIHYEPAATFKYLLSTIHCNIRHYYPFQAAKESWIDVIFTGKSYDFQPGKNLVPVRYSNAEIF